MKANRKVLGIKVGLIVALMILISLSGMTLIRIQQFAESAKAVEETHLVIEALHQILLDVKDAESAQRGYLLTGHADFLLAHDAVAQRLVGRLTTLRDLTSGHLKQRDQIPILQDMIVQRMETLASGIALFRAPILDRGQIVDLIQGQGMSSMAQLHVQVHRMLATEEEELKRRAALVSHNAASSRQWIFFGNLFAVSLLLYGVWAILREIEQRKLAQRETQKSMAQLELTNKELESFSYSVSHDLRSPLRAIDGYSRILQEDYADKLDDEGRRILNVVRDSSKKMGMLIDDLLTFSKLGRKPVELRQIDMNELVDDVWRDVTSHADKVPTFNKAYLLPCYGDRALVRQVLFNLLSNSIKYSSTVSEPVIDIFSTEEEDEIVYSVRDNGVGFDMRYYDKLFGVFQRLHSESEFPGTGVGLAIVKRVVVRHGGRVWAQSEPAKETIFNFSLPTEVSA
ncbi:MAG: CHASE3 domain-containing protein [Oxalicibacterium faecigallinarum]|uniref:sensor histidine kinase n=1 Tax=Oxalicibacterium faecigallinarum TaxID=573741 RepID=UPI002807ED7E|nr:ATP-binding protein [Oxalicibacterium faecigallinarum]MDQ7970324.1 CHASE3 domain-containing protein [Oxalicibacterium faecigallinarum]